MSDDPSLDRYDKVWVRAGVAEAPDQGEVLVRIEGRQTKLDNNLFVSLGNVLPIDGALGASNMNKAAAWDALLVELPEAIDNGEVTRTTREVCQLFGLESPF